MTSLRKFRYDKGFQRQFIASKVGICGKHLNDIESGKVNLTENIANRLSEIYGVNSQDIILMYKEGRDEK